MSNVLNFFPPDGLRTLCALAELGLEREEDSLRQFQSDDPARAEPQAYVNLGKQTLRFAELLTQASAEASAPPPAYEASAQVSDEVATQQLVTALIVARHVIASDQYSSASFTAGILHIIDTALREVGAA